MQNWPNFFSDATFKPLLRTVTSVSVSSDLAVEKDTGGKFGIGSDRGGRGVALGLGSDEVDFSASCV